MIEVITKKWNNIFTTELKGTKCLRIISPFITENIVKKILSVFKGSEIHVITRFNLNDFRSGVSSLGALQILLDHGAKIQGIHNLHSKLYLFDNKTAIITSANLTTKAFYNNFEFGVRTNDSTLLQKSLDYFLWLGLNGGSILKQELIDDWNDQIEKAIVPKNEYPLPDFGIIPAFQNEPKYFVKFLGSQNNRVDNAFMAKEEIKRAHCHYALCYPENNGKPKRYNNGDIVFISRLLKEKDYAIFGRGVALKHDKKKDRVSKEELVTLPWKTSYPIYIRIKDVKFLNTNMGNCPKMSQLIDQFKAESFSNTQKRFLKGEKNINPRNSLRQRADIQLSTMAGIWLEEAFQAAESNFHLVTKTFIDSLDQGSSY